MDHVSSSIIATTVVGFLLMVLIVLRTRERVNRILTRVARGVEVVASGPNPVAAVPSLHIAYPTYLALISITVWGKRGLPVILLPFRVLFSAVYLGHHYVVDGLIGAGYALAVYLLLYLWLRRAHIDLNIFARQKARATPPITRTSTSTQR